MNLFNKNSEIKKYNLVTKSNQVIPNYDLDNREISIVLYFSPEETVCIIGKVDNNYICWCSITKLNDTDINRNIFNYLAGTNLEVFSNEHLVFGYGKYKEIRNWYKCEITKSNRAGMVWQTPFGHSYGETNHKNYHGQFFAGDIVRFYKELQDKCSFRIQGSYVDILNNYLEILKAADHYNKVKPLISILEHESYLRLTPDEKLRMLYLSCMEESSSLYNRYMDKIR